MNQEQYQWLKDNGYDPAVYDVDDQGNVFENPVSAPATQKKMSPLRAAGTSFLGSLAPSAAGLYAGAQTGALGGSLAGPVGSVLGAIGGGLAGGYGAGKLQEAALERFAPSVQEELARAQTDQPIASYLGGFAPNALALRPSLGGLKGLTAPLMSMERDAMRAAFTPAAVNVGANVAGATAGQLVDLAQGGEFSAPRFAADVALGSLFADPTRIGRRLGLQPLTPETAAPERLDLAGRRGELAAAEAARADEAASARATELLGGEAKPAVKPLDQIVDPRRANIEENRRAIEKTLTGLTKETPPADLVQDLANDPFVGNLRDDPAALQEFIFNKADKYLQQAFARGKLAPEFTGQMMGAMRERAEAFTPEGGVRVAPADWVPTSERVTRQPATTEEVLGRAPVAEEGTPLEQAIKPTPEEIAKAEKIQAENARIEAEQNAAELQKLQDLEAAQALSDEAAARLEALQARQTELLRLAQRAPAVIRRGVAEQGAPDIARAKQELADARAIADDLLARLQRAGGEGQITQADLDAAAQLAARRGLKLQFTTPEQQAQGLRGAYLINEAGERVIYIDANAATRDTAIHEIGHDVFVRSAGERMKRSLMQTAEDSPAFKAEYEARLAEVDENGQRINTEAQARDLALEEGVIQAFGEAYPNVPQGDIRRWFNALKASLKSMVGMKLSPEDAARWLHYATTEAVPWKGAVVGKGGDVGGDEATRYQRGLTGKAAEAVKTGIDKTLPEIDQITRRGGIYETVGRALTRMYNTAQSMFGRSQAIAPEIYKLSDADAIKLTRHLLQEHRTRTRITPAPEITAAYNEWRNTVKRFWVDENNAVGNTIRQGTGVRERLSDEFWLPFHKESDDVRKILSERVGTPEYQKLKDDYVREATDSYLQKGMNQQDARNKAIADFEQERSVILAPFDPAAPATFAGARKPQGRPLPESWGELNFRDLLESYNRRSAKDYAAQTALERSPEVMTALGAQKMHNDQPIPAAVLQNTPIISTDPSVQSVMREFSGRPLQTPGKFVRGVGSVASALALQTISRIGDIGGTVVKPLAYVGLGDYATYMSGMADKLSNWSQLQLRSIESGLNNPNAHQNFRQAISVGDDAGKYMRRFVDSMGSLTLSNKLEEVARTLAQAQGEMIVSINKRRAATGDKEAIRFLDTLNPDWRTTGDTDLGGQFGLLMQGSYDMRQLPAWFLESGAAPYLTWSKWSMSQLNNFRKFAVEPAMQGDFKPLIAQMLIGMAGGGAIEEIQEWLNNKESKAINWSELQSWAEQNQGEIGSDGGQLLMQKLLMMSQKTGTFGFAGDLMLLPVNALVGDTQGVIGAYPALELTTDLAKNIGGALGAIDKGEDVGLVLKRFGKNMIVGKTQVLRVISNWADELENEGIENLRSADRRKQRLFDELNGMSRAGMFPVSYDNLSEQEFERGAIDEDTGEEALALVTRAREEATSREDYASRIRKYKTSQNQIMPSLERQPMKAARYLSFVEGAEEGAGAETMRRYMIRKQEDNYRKSLIEGLSGLR